MNAHERPRRGRHLPGQFGQARAVQLRQGTIDAQEHDHDQFAILVVFQVVLRAPVVAQGKVLNAAADAVGTGLGLSLGKECGKD